jgi:hypothetical protein
MESVVKYHVEKSIPSEVFITKAINRLHFIIKDNSGQTIDYVCMLGTYYECYLEAMLRAQIIADQSIEPRGLTVTFLGK